MSWRFSRRWRGISVDADVPVCGFFFGGPGTATTVPAHHLFETAFLYNRLGYASAIGFLLAIVILVFSLINLKFIKTMEL